MMDITQVGHDSMVYNFILIKSLKDHIKPPLVSLKIKLHQTNNKHMNCMNYLLENLKKLWYTHLLKIMHAMQNS